MRRSHLAVRRSHLAVQGPEDVRSGFDDDDGTDGHHPPIPAHICAGTRPHLCRDWRAAIAPAQFDERFQASLSRHRRTLRRRRLCAQHRQLEVCGCTDTNEYTRTHAQAHICARTREQTPPSARVLTADSYRARACPTAHPRALALCFACDFRRIGLSHRCACGLNGPVWSAAAAGEAPSAEMTHVVDALRVLATAVCPRPSSRRHSIASACAAEHAHSCA